MPFAAKGGILSITLRDRVALYESYMPFVKDGGLFVETDKRYAIGDEVFVLVELLDNPEPIPAAAKVIWISPKGSNTHKAGIGLQLGADNRDLVNQIETQLAEALNSSKPTHTM